MDISLKNSINGSTPPTKRLPKDQVKVLFRYQCPGCSAYLRSSDRHEAHVRCKNCAFDFIVDARGHVAMIAEIQAVANGSSFRLWMRLKAWLGWGKSRQTAEVNLTT